MKHQGSIHQPIYVKIVAEVTNFEGHVKDFGHSYFVTKLYVSVYQPPNYSYASSLEISNPYFIKKILTVLSLKTHSSRDKELAKMIFDRLPRSLTLDMKDYSFIKDMNPILNSSNKSFCVLIDRGGHKFLLEIWTLEMQKFAQ